MKNDLQHVDFQHVSMDEEIKAVAPIRIVGREALESRRLVLIRQIDEVKIVGLPQDIPEHVEIDVSDMEAGDTVTIGDIKYRMELLLTKILTVSFLLSANLRKKLKAQTMRSRNPNWLTKKMEDE